MKQTERELRLQRPEGSSSDVLQYLKTRQEDMLATLRRLVEMESPSDHKPSVDRLGEALAGDFRRLGGQVKVHPARNFGDHLQIDFPGGDTRRKPVLLLGHLDTVYPMGSIYEMPFHLERGRAFGPGVLDMKSGIIHILYAIEALQKCRSVWPRPVTVFLVSDEEVSSESSRPVTEALARKSGAVLVMEPSAGLTGKLKTSRKGVGDYTLKVTGRAAHSGLDFEKGDSAILELAHQIQQVAKITNLKRGITVNPGVIHGGTRSNVIAAQAMAVCDARIQKQPDAQVVDRKFHSLKVRNRRCRLEVTGGFDRPPMERTAAVAALFHMARTIAREMNWKLEETGVGGGSGGNFTSAMGIPTLDGLGGVGEGAHAPHECILVNELPRRTTLLARLIESI